MAAILSWTQYVKRLLALVMQAPGFEFTKDTPYLILSANLRVCVLSILSML